MASGFYCRWSPIRFSVCLTCGLLGLSGKFLGIDYAMSPNREWNQKTKT